jgi:hypothetical protein
MQALVHRGHHHTGEHAANLADSCEDSRSFGDFQRFVPATEDVDGAAVET